MMFIEQHECTSICDQLDLEGLMQLKDRLAGEDEEGRDEASGVLQTPEEAEGTQSSSEEEDTEELGPE